MPWGLTSVLLMPFGAEGFPLLCMIKGIGWINAVAHMVSAWPGHLLLAPQMPGIGLGLCAASGLWLVLAVGRIRLVGGLVLAVGLSSSWWTPLPDLLIADEGCAIAVCGVRDHGFLGEGRGSAFLRSVWQSRTGRAMLPGSGWRCDAEGCVGAARPGWIVARSDYPQGLDGLCARASVVVARYPVAAEQRANCAVPLLDPSDLRATGAVIFWLTDDGTIRRRQADAERLGRRP